MRKHFKSYFPKVLLAFTIFCTLVFFQFEQKASMYDRNLYSVFDYALPMDFKVEEFQGVYSIYDYTGNYFLMLEESNFPISSSSKVKSKIIYIEKILMISTYDDTLRVIAKSSKGDLKLITIKDYIGDYKIETILKPSLDLSRWYDLELVPTYIKMWPVCSIAISYFLGILFLTSIVTLIGQRISSTNIID